MSVMSKGVRPGSGLLSGVPGRRHCGGPLARDELWRMWSENNWKSHEKPMKNHTKPMRDTLRYMEIPHFVLISMFCSGNGGDALPNVLNARWSHQRFPMTPTWRHGDLLQGKCLLMGGFHEVSRWKNDLFQKKTWQFFLWFSGFVRWYHWVSGMVQGPGCILSLCWCLIFHQWQWVSTVQFHVNHRPFRYSMRLLGSSQKMSLEHWVKTGFSPCQKGMSPFVPLFWACYTYMEPSRFWGFCHIAAMIFGKHLHEIHQLGKKHRFCQSSAFK